MFLLWDFAIGNLDRIHHWGNWIGSPAGIRMNGLLNIIPTDYGTPRPLFLLLAIGQTAEGGKGGAKATASGGLCFGGGRGGTKGRGNLRRI
jgi:hypothetical protein